MSLSVAQGFTKSLAMTVLSEIGDKTFFAAAILAMRHPRRLVLSGCLGALIVMTILSAVVGWAAPNLLQNHFFPYRHSEAKEVIQNQDRSFQSIKSSYWLSNWNFLHEIQTVIYT